MRAQLRDTSCVMRRVRATSAALVVSVVGSVLAPARFAHAQQGARAEGAPGKEDAKKLFEEGAELEKKADYTGRMRCS